MSKNVTIPVPAVETPVTIETPAVETPATPATEGLESGLESTDVPLDSNKIDFSNREYLEKNVAVITTEFASSKFDAEREAKVQAGLLTIKELMGDKVNQLLLLLGKYWEIKPARSAIKKMIDAEAKSLNVNEDYYLQKTLRENVDKLAAISQAIDRLKYSITYFKPRGGIDIKPIYQMMTIDGIMYNVDLAELAKARAEYGEDKVAIKAHLAEISTKVVIDEIL
jgi:hypothetical protein